jgi:hypothetical protein
LSTVQKYTNVGNTRAKFRDSFANPEVAQPSPERWDLSNPNSGHIITQGGDSSGSSYLRISLDPFTDDTEVSITSKDTFNVPTRVGFGLSLSQRILGQEVFIGMVGCDEFENVKRAPVPDPIQITASIVIASNVATITLPGHGFKGGDRVTMFGHTTPQLNVGPVAVTVVDANTFTVPCTHTSATYTAGGYIQHVDPLGGAHNGAGYLFENTTTTNASFVSRRNGAKFRTANSTVATTTAIQSNTNPYTDAFNSAASQELYFALDEVSYRSFAADGGAGISGYGKYTQAVPDEDNEYKLQVRAKILRASTRAVAKIASVTKTASTLATVTTVEPHGLAVTDFVQIYGVRDQTNFANTAAQTAIASIVSPTVFTITFGASATATSYGGAVFANEGSVLAPGAIGQSIQSIVRTNGIMTLIGSGTWSGLLPGEYVHLYGMTENGADVYEGAYKVLRLSTTTLEVEAPGPDFTILTTGGQVIKRTDVRLHFARLIDYTRLGVEVLGGKGQTNDANNAVPVTIAGSVSLTATGAQTQGAGSTSQQWSAAGYGGFLVADVASAAITSTATTSATTPGLLANFGTYAHSFNVVVTAVSGTTPTLDVGVEESVDNGTNWVRIYDFPRITANGAYSSPLLRANAGTRYRYVQTITGTTPSFTRAINRVTYSADAPLIRQFIDRTVNPNTLNASTPNTFNVDGSTRIQLTVTMGAITTTPPVFALQGSDDGVNWYTFGPDVTTVASSAATGIVTDFMPKFARAYVKTAGVGATLNNVLIKAHGA